MYQAELLQVAESLAGLMPRLARGLSAADGGPPRGGDPADELPLAQLRVCGILSEGPRAMSALSRELGVSLSALTQIADRLERAALVKRTAAVGGDRRVRCLRLTRRGETMMRRHREARMRRSLAVLEQLSGPERELVRTAVETLVSACSRAQGDPPADRRLDAAGGGNGKNHNLRQTSNKKSRTRTSL